MATPSAMADLDQLLTARGFTAELGAPITAAAFNHAGSHAGFALGDGTLRLTDANSWTTAQIHDGAILALAADPVANGFLTGGDDGKLAATALDGTITPRAAYGAKWVEHIAAWPGKNPLFAAAVGKNLHLFSGDGKPQRSLSHPSTVTGIAFDSKGKRVAAAHYNGASLWFTASASDTPKKFEWKGSHIGVAIHPGGEALVTAMQENALHGWTLPDAKHMRMSGYPAKTESFGFTKSGRWLATAGADALVLWPFFGGGPMGKAPVELGGAAGIIKRVACHPEHEIVAAGFDTGLLLIVDTIKEKILPVCGPGRGPITALAWNHTGSHLAFGTAPGFAAVVNFANS